MPDIEKLLAKVFTYSIQHSIAAVFFHDVSLQKMREFRMLLKSLCSVRGSLVSLQELCEQGSLKSARLKTLLTCQAKGGLYPDDVDCCIEEFNKLIEWKLVPGLAMNSREAK